MDPCGPSAPGALLARLLRGHRASPNLRHDGLPVRLMPGRAPSTMGQPYDVCLPGLPDCWESCGNCSDGELTVIEVLVAPGDPVRADTPVLVLETDKTTLDIAADRAGQVVELAVAVGDRVVEGQLLLRIAPVAGA